MVNAINLYQSGVSFGISDNGFPYYSGSIMNFMGIILLNVAEIFISLLDMKNLTFHT